MAEEKIDKEVFDTFFKENYCTLDYASIKNDFEAIAERGVEAIFSDDADISKITGKNFIVYMRGDTYCEFEEIVEETFDSLNPEITDAVMDLSVSLEDADEVTAIYWDTCEELLKNFLGILFEKRIRKMLEEY